MTAQCRIPEYTVNVAPIPDNEDEYTDWEEAEAEALIIRAEIDRRKRERLALKDLEWQKEGF